MGSEGWHEQDIVEGCAIEGVDLYCFLGHTDYSYRVSFSGRVSYF